MDENLEPNNKPDMPLPARHEKMLTPLNPNIQPEAPAPAQPSSPAPIQPSATPIYPEPTSGAFAANGPQQPTLSPPPSTDTKPVSKAFFWTGRIIKLIAAGIVGFIIGGAYYQYWDSGILNKAMLMSQHYSPLAFGDTLIPFVIFVLVYSLVFHFVLRSKYAFGQAVFAFSAVHLLVLILLGIEYFGKTKFNIIDGGADMFTVAAAIIGVIVFVLTNYLAERIWTFKISRAMLAVSTLVLMTFISFGISQVHKTNYDETTQREKAQSDQAMTEYKAGDFNFDGGYQQYYLNDTVQNRFQVVQIGATSKTPSEDFKDYPHATTLELKDKEYKGTNDAFTIDLWQSKVPPSYNPPKNCGNPSVTMDYIGIQSKTGLYDGVCNKIQDIPGIGTVYGRNQYNDPPYPDEQATKSYDWYYLRYGDTLIAFESLKTINGSDAVSIFSNLTPISPADFLAKSKALASKTQK